MNLSQRHKFILGTIILVLILIVIFVPMWQSAVYQNKITPDLSNLEPKDRVTALKDVELYENSARTTLAQIVGGLVLLAGLYFAYQNAKTAQIIAEIAQENLRITEEGKITDRFSKAIELLGSDKLDIRLGGIYALARISRDSKDDHWTVMEVLTAFVRENAPFNSHQKEESKEQVENKPREDIQAIMTVIGKRNWSETETEKLNLRAVNLSKYNLSNANLSGASLSGANLEKASLHFTNLKGAFISGANFSGAFLSAAILERCHLSRVNFSEADMYGVNLKFSYLDKTCFTRADLQEANLTEATIKETDFTNAELRQTNLSKIIFSETNFSKANLYEADLNQSDLRHYNLITFEQLLSTRNYENAQLPLELVEKLKERKANAEKISRMLTLKKNTVAGGDSSESQAEE